MPDPQRFDGTRPPWQPRFGLGGLMLVMLICSVMASAAYYLVRATEMGRSYQTVFLLVTLVAPVLLVIIISNLQALLRGRRR